MRPNNLLTTLLYALLVALVMIAIWKGCEMQRDQQAKAQEDAELERTMRELGYVDEDSTEYGTAYAGEADTVNSLAPTADDLSDRNRDGIEDDEPAARPTTPSTAAKGARTNASPGPAANTTTTPNVDNELDAPVRTQAARPAVTTDATPDLNVNRDARYRVVAGSFTRMDGARRRLEDVIQMGYTNAEVGKYNRGKYAVVIVKRTNDLNEAVRIVDRLEAKGIDASVIERRD